MLILQKKMWSQKSISRNVNLKEAKIILFKETYSILFFDRLL